MVTQHASSGRGILLGTASLGSEPWKYRHKTPKKQGGSRKYGGQNEVTNTLQKTQRRPLANFILGKGNLLLLDDEVR